MKHKFPQTIYEFSRLIAAGERFQIVLGNFLDEFKRAPAQLSLEQPPCVLEKEQMVFLAALAEYLADENGFSVPGWANAPEFSFENPIYPTKNEAYRRLLLSECPQAFKRRGFIVSANALVRA